MTIFFFYPIKKTVPCNIAYNMFMINSFYQIGALFLPKGINRSEINETNWANFIHCKIYISLYSCKKKERVIIPIIYLNSNLRSSISNSLYCMTLLLTCSSIWIFLYKLQRYYEEAGKKREAISRTVFSNFSLRNTLSKINRDNSDSRFLSLLSSSLLISSRPPFSSPFSDSRFS